MKQRWIVVAAVGALALGMPLADRMSAWGNGTLPRPVTREEFDKLSAEVRRLRVAVATLRVQVVKLEREAEPSVTPAVEPESPGEAVAPISFRELMRRWERLQAAKGKLTFMQAHEARKEFFRDLAVVGNAHVKDVGPSRVAGSLDVDLQVRGPAQWIVTCRIEAAVAQDLNKGEPVRFEGRVKNMGLMGPPVRSTIVLVEAKITPLKR